MKKYYAVTSVWLHWLMLLLFLAVYCSIEFRVLFEKGTDARDLMKTLHFTFGLSIFILAIVRLITRLVTTPPERENYGHRHLFIYKSMFFALYGLMFVMPILGWLIVSLEGHNIVYLGFELPNLFTLDKALAHQFEEIHEIIGKVGYGLIACHAIAALFHHYRLKDNTLIRMSKFK